MIIIPILEKNIGLIQSRRIHVCVCVDESTGMSNVSRNLSSVFRRIVEYLVGKVGEGRGRVSKDGGDGEVSIMGDGDEELDIIRVIIEETELGFAGSMRGSGEEGEVFPGGVVGGIEGLIGGLLSGPS